MSQFEPTAHWKGQEPRVAILVLGCLLQVYDRCIRTIRASWGSQTATHADIFYVYGGQHAHAEPDMVDIEQLIGRPAPLLQDNAVWVSGDIILCGTADVYAGQDDCILRKRLIAFDYLANQQRYDYVYTVCAASYVDVPALQDYVRALPASGVFQGPLGVHEASGDPFVSGASMLLSRDIAADVADHAQAILANNTDHAPDDVAISRWIARAHCAESAAEICRRIGASQTATANQTFVLPFGRGMVDFVWAPTHTHVPHDSTYHYHFHSARMEDMEAFHRRYFTR